MEGLQLRVGSWVMGLGSAVFAITGFVVTFAALRGVINPKVDPITGVIPGNWQSLDGATYHGVLLLFACTGLLAVLAGVGAFGLAIYGVRRGENWAWNVGAISDASFTVPVVIIHSALGAEAWPQLLPIYGIIVPYSIGLAMTRRFMV